ncbi:hypothetical protein BH11MYX3_BH11MYX3_01870 [soil metagenome]
MVTIRTQYTLLLLSLGGCFFELGGGYYPTTKQTVVDPMAATTMIHDEGAAWSASVKVGLYFDIPVVKGSGIAVGWSPNGWGTDLIIKDKPAAEAGDGTMLRADLTLPINLFSSFPRINTRIVGEYGWYTDGGVRRPGIYNYDERSKASGHRWFLGPALSFSTIGGSVIVAGGLQRMTVSIPIGTEENQWGADTSGWGFGGSITLTLTPTSHYGHIAFASSPVISSSPGPATNNCYYNRHCSPDGSCKTEYVCP